MIIIIIVLVNFRVQFRLEWNPIKHKYIHSIIIISFRMVEKLVMLMDNVYPVLILNLAMYSIYPRWRLEMDT